jgi:predicted dehydrogenase
MKAGIIGFKHGHAHHFARSRGWEPVAFAEEDKALRESIASTYPHLKPYSDYREMLDLEDLEVVGLAEVNGLRAGIAAYSLKEGLHVISDKPIATSLKGLDLIEEALGKGTSNLSMMLTERINPRYYTLKALINEGVLGQVVAIDGARIYQLNRRSRPDWMFARETYGGILVDIGVHDVDQVRWMTGEDIENVLGYHSNVRYVEDKDFEDNGRICLNLKGGARASIEVNWLAPEGARHWGWFRVIGTRGYAQIESTVEYVNANISGEGQVKFQLRTPHVSDLVEDFIRSIEEPGYTGLIDTRDVLAATKATLLARESADKRGSISKPY